jgi:hypothetical protein
MSLTDDLKKRALDEGFDLVGVAVPSSLGMKVFAADELSAIVKRLARGQLCQAIEVGPVDATARKLRPRSRPISRHRPSTDPRREGRCLRWGEEPGSMSYSAVIHPRPEL